MQAGSRMRCQCSPTSGGNAACCLIPFYYPAHIENIMTERFGKDMVIALATVEKGVPFK